MKFCTNILNFSKKGHFCSKFHEIQILSQIVLHNCGWDLHSLIFQFLFGIGEDVRILWDAEFFVKLTLLHFLNWDEIEDVRILWDFEFFEKLTLFHFLDWDKISYKHIRIFQKKGIIAPSSTKFKFWAK